MDNIVGRPPRRVANTLTLAHQIPRTLEEALELDRANNNTAWRDAFNDELTHMRTHFIDPGVNGSISGVINAPPSPPLFIARNGEIPADAVRVASPPNPGMEPMGINDSARTTLTSFNVMAHLNFADNGESDSNPDFP